MRSLQTELKPEELDSIVRLVSAGRAHLLLGAGASADSQRANGKPMPLGGQLAEMIRSEFDFADDLDLAGAASRLGRQGRSADLYEYLHSVFGSCKPAAWYSDLVSNRWRAIWNLNVDNVTEAAYEQWRGAQKVRSFHFADEVDYRGDEVPVVHLHGRVHDRSSSEVVFSLRDYVDLISKEPRWHAEFENAWRSEAFIVVGARLVDEYDFVRFIEAHRPADSPSIFVSPSMTDETMEDIRLLGLIPVRMRAADFFSELGEFVGQRGGGIADPEVRNAVQPLMSEFDLLPSLAELPPRNHDLLRGSRALMADISSSKHLKVAWHSEFANHVERLVRESSASTIVLANGRAFSGKTVGLLSAAWTLHERGHLVLMHSGGSIRDLTTIVRVANKLSQPLLLFTDDFSRYAATFDHLIQRIGSGGGQVVVCGAVRSERFSFSMSLLSRASFHDENLKSAHLTAQDARSIDKQLDERVALNRLYKWDKRARVKLFLEQGLAVGLYKTNHDDRFLEKALDEIRADGDAGIALLAVACILQGYELNLPTAWISEIRLAESEAHTTFFERQGNYSRLLFSGLIEDLARREVDSGALQALILEIMRKAAPGINKRTIRSGNDAAEIGKTLVRFMTLKRWIGVDDASRLLELSERFLGWDGGYWEQRARAARGLKDFDRAEAFAAKGAHELPDSRRFATLGQVRAWRACGDPDLVLLDRLELLLRALEDLEESYGLSDTNPNSVVNSMRGLVEFAELFGSKISDASMVDLMGRWSNWSRRSSSAHMTSLRNLEDEVDRLKARWEASMDRILND